MDLAAKHVGNLQDMTHTAQQHQHGLIQEQIGAQADHARAQQQHEAEMQRAAAAHEAEMNRMHQKHALTLKHTQELNEQKVAAAKAMAAAKPKKAKKAA
jgi:hypothetical protein